MTETRNLLRIGTRRSPLALWQAEYVRSELMLRNPKIEVQLVPIETKGDKILDVSLSKVGGKGLFVKELEVALLAGEVDLCVHSAKDMPAELPAGLGLVCFPPRADPRDALVLGGEGGIRALPMGAKVGTSSLRRQAQLLHQRPDLEIVPLRGNIQTRMRKVEELGLHCAVLACAGLDRMGEEAKIAHRLEVDEMLPAAAQGVLAVEARVQDAFVCERLSELDDAGAREAAVAERAFLARLGGGCQVPISAHCKREGQRITLWGMVARPDGSDVVRTVASMSVGAYSPAEFGDALGQKILRLGAQQILEDLGLGGSPA